METDISRDHVGAATAIYSSEKNLTDSHLDMLAACLKPEIPA
jgi:hypothetical protein